jgi:hypothetical protein
VHADAAAPPAPVVHLRYCERVSPLDALGTPPGDKNVPPPAKTVPDINSLSGPWVYLAFRFEQIFQPRRDTSWARWVNSHTLQTGPCVPFDSGKKRMVPLAGKAAVEPGETGEPAPHLLRGRGDRAGRGPGSMWGV